MKISRYLSICLALAGLFAGCTPADPSEQVPEGVLRIFADRTRIKADGADAVTFKVMYGSKEVTQQPTLTIKVKSENTEFNLANGSTKFSTATAGQYTFSASYYYGGNIESDNAVTVEAMPAAQTQSKYYQKMLGMQFTSVYCPSCPSLSASIESVQAAYPGRISNVSFHVNDMGADPMCIEACGAFFRTLKVSDGLPAFTFNVRKSSQHIISEYSKIVEEMEHQLKNYPAICGVALETSLEAGQIKVTFKINSEVSAEYKYHVFLVEDGLDQYDQMGATENYVHNNVLRYSKSDNVWGLKFNSGKALEAGKEYTQETSIPVDSQWNLDNCRVIVAAMLSTDGGTTYNCNNLNECAVGESADYLYADQPSELYKRTVSVMEFTGQWCAQCPLGASTINYYASEVYPGRMCIMAFHNANGGDGDIFETPEEAVLFSQFNPGGYPGYVLDMSLSGIVNSGTFGRSLDERMKLGSYSSLELEPSIASDEISVKVGLNSLVAASYRLAVYVTEDKIVAKQNNGGTYIDSYTHRHVVRRMLSGSVLGDKLGSVQSGVLAEKTYSFVPDPQWNLDNLSVCVLSIGEDGTVDNAAECKIKQQ